MKTHIDSKKKYLESDVVKMFEFLLDNIFVKLTDVYQQTIRNPIGTNCAPILVDLFLYSYEAIFYQLKKNSFGET